MMFKMEIEILLTSKKSISLGVADRIYYMQFNPNGFWEKIPVDTEQEAIKYFDEKVK